MVAPSSQPAPSQLGLTRPRPSSRRASLRALATRRLGTGTPWTISLSRASLRALTPSGWTPILISPRCSRTALTTSNGTRYLCWTCLRYPLLLEEEVWNLKEAVRLKKLPLGWEVLNLEETAKLLVDEEVLNRKETVAQPLKPRLNDLLNLHVAVASEASEAPDASDEASAHQADLTLRRCRRRRHRRGRQRGRRRHHRSHRGRRRHHRSHHRSDVLAVRRGDNARSAALGFKASGRRARNTWRKSQQHQLSCHCCKQLHQLHEVGFCALIICISCVSCISELPTVASSCR